MVLRTFNFWGFCGPYRESPYYFRITHFRIIGLLYRIKAWSTIFGSFFNRKGLFASEKGIALAPFPNRVWRNTILGCI